MSSQEKENSVSSFPEKYNKILRDLPEFKDIADGSSPDELKKMIYQAEANIYVVEKEKQEDHKLQGAREIVKEHMAPYKDAVKVQTAKSKYCLFLLESKGVNLEK